VESGGSDKEIEKVREDINSRVSRGKVVLYSLLPRLVILTDLIAQNTDFVVLE
jgi:hypothetical protein